MLVTLTSLASLVYLLLLDALVLNLKKKSFLFTKVAASLLKETKLENFPE